MSETNEDDPQADATFDEKAPKKSGASASIAWLALFLSLLTVAGVGYLLLEKMRSDSSADASDAAFAALERELDASDQSIENLQGSVGKLSADDTRTGSAIDSLRRDIEQRAELLDSLPPRMSNLERSVAALQGVSIEARNTYLIAEAEYYMQIANAQLQLAGNPYLASMALEQADDRLLQMADPALTATRAAIADELTALEVMEKPDIAGVTLMLASLARVVDSLPLRSAGGTTAAAAEADEGELSGPDRAWAAVKDAASGLIKITPPDGDKAALITPDVADLARSNLSLQLQAARLALLRGEQEIFEQSLDDADAWLSLYFDTRSEQVRSARQTMAEIRAEYTSAAAPDISQSLRQLRQYKILAGNAQ
jgi:uroporphyrin-3 C-methyltransferase